MLVDWWIVPCATVQGSGSIVQHSTVTFHDGNREPAYTPSWTEPRTIPTYHPIKLSFMTCKGSLVALTFPGMAPKVSLTIPSCVWGLSKAHAKNC